MMKFTSYNVLSSSLSDPQSHSGSNPIYLLPSYRFELVKKKLLSEMNDNSIICLQEISHSWAGQLHVFFSSHGYYFVTGLYGNKWNGYMGVGIAVPLDKYEIMHVDITRIADTKVMPKDIKLGYLQQVLNKTKKWMINFLISLGCNIFKPMTKIEEFWDNCLYRTNQMISLKLKTKQTSITTTISSSPTTEEEKTFVVSTYHMPCMFQLPSVMVTHCALAAQHTQKLAKSDPYVLIGDFNIKPASSQYKLLTTGSISKEDPDYPLIKESDNWTPTVEPPLQSAYVSAINNNQKEPDFTNYSQFKQNPVFIDTLDYIFHSSYGWKAHKVLELPSRNTFPGPIPNELEPSDHLLISAELSLL